MYHKLRIFHQKSLYPKTFFQKKYIIVKPRESSFSQNLNFNLDTYKLLTINIIHYYLQPILHNIYKLTIFCG